MSAARIVRRPPPTSVACPDLRTATAPPARSATTERSSSRPQKLWVDHALAPFTRRVPVAIAEPDSYPTPMPSRPPLLGPSPTRGTSTTPTPTPPPAPRARPSPTPTRTPSPTSTPGCPVRDDGNRHDRDDKGIRDLLDSDDDNTDVRDRGDRDHDDDRRHHCPDEHGDDHHDDDDD